jgi:hypothetical protein
VVFNILFSCPGFPYPVLFNPLMCCCGSPILYHSISYSEPWLPSPVVFNLLSCSADSATLLFWLDVLTGRLSQLSAPPDFLLQLCLSLFLVTGVLLIKRFFHFPLPKILGGELFLPCLRRRGGWPGLGGVSGFWLSGDKPQTAGRVSLLLIQSTQNPGEGTGQAPQQQGHSATRCIARRW